MLTVMVVTFQVVCSAVLQQLLLLLLEWHCSMMMIMMKLRADERANVHCRARRAAVASTGSASAGFPQSSYFSSDLPPPLVRMPWMLYH